MSTEKKNPELPEAVAKKYIAPNGASIIVTRPHPKTGKRKTVDLSKISLEEAEQLVDVYKTSSLVKKETETKALKESK